MVGRKHPWPRMNGLMRLGSSAFSASSISEQRFPPWMDANPCVHHGSRRAGCITKRCTSGSEGGRQKPAVPTLHGADARPLRYIPTWASFLYLAFVIDAFSRRVVGWAMETYLRTELVLKALNMAIWQRSPQRGNPSLRPGLPVQLDRLRPALPCRWCAASDGLTHGDPRL